MWEKKDEGIQSILSKIMLNVKILLFHVFIIIKINLENIKMLDIKINPDKKNQVDLMKGFKCMKNFESIL